MSGAVVLSLWLACGSEAAVRLRVAPGPDAPALLARTREVAGALLQAPRERAIGGGLLIEGSGWSAEPAAPRRETILVDLRAAWGGRLSVEEDTPAPVVAATPARSLPAMDREGLERAAARLKAAPELSGKAALDLFYDGGTRGSASVPASGAAGGARELAGCARPRRVTSAPPAPAAGRGALAAGRGAPAASARPAAPITPASAGTAGLRPARPVSWRRLGVEVLKGAGGVVRDVFTWKGLAVAAASVALITVAPVAVYAILAVGAVTAGWTIGKALARGYDAHRRKDAEGVYAAARDFGRGAFTLGLTLLGARHPPVNLRPHLPHSTGEWQAVAAAMDDEPVIVMSLLRKE